MFILLLLLIHCCLVSSTCPTQALWWTTNVQADKTTNAALACHSRFLEFLNFSTSIIQEEACAAQGGECSDRCNCEGTLLHGLCPLQPNSIKCCPKAVDQIEECEEEVNDGDNTAGNNNNNNNNSSNNNSNNNNSNSNSNSSDNNNNNNNNNNSNNNNNNNNNKSNNNNNNNNNNNEIFKVFLLRFIPTGDQLERSARPVLQVEEGRWYVNLFSIKGTVHVAFNSAFSVI